MPKSNRKRIKDNAGNDDDNIESITSPATRRKIESKTTGVMTKQSAAKKQDIEKDELVSSLPKPSSDCLNKKSFTQFNNLSNRLLIEAVENNQTANQNVSMQINLDKQLLIEQIEKAKKGDFPAKLFTFCEKIKFYSPILNLFHCNTVFDVKPVEPIIFKCIACSNSYSYKIGKTTNLNRHLRDIKYKNHNQLTFWLQEYDKVCPRNKKKPEIDEGTYLLVRYFISSNSALTELENPFLQKICEMAKINLHGYNSFRNIILPKVMTHLDEVLSTKLQVADSICLITDIWSIRSKGFISVSANLRYPSMERECVVLNMMEMNDTQHNAENIKDCIENMINKFNFNKSKIIGN